MSHIYEMQRCKVVTWILILFIVNFALGAPVGVRERLETSIDVDVAEGGAATSQKRHDPLDDWSTSNAADRPPTPPNLNPSEVIQLWEEVAERPIDRYSPPTPESPGSAESVDSTWTESNPGSPEGSHAGSAGGSPLPPLPHEGPSEGHFLSTSGPSVNPGTLLPTDHQPTLPQRPTGGSPLPPLPHPGPSEGRFPSPPGFSVNPDTLSSTGHQPTPPQSPTGDSPPPPPPPPPATSLGMDTLSSTGHQPTPPQSPEPDSGVHAPSNPVPEPQPSASEAEAGAANLLSKVFNGRIKPRISRSGSTSR